MKKAAALFLAVFMVVTLVACAAGGPELGTYNGVKGKFVGDTEWSTEDEFSIELKAGGKGVFNREGESFDVTWKLEGETFTMTETFLGLSIEYTGTLKDGVLDIFNNDPEDDLTYEYVLEKN